MQPEQKSSINCLEVFGRVRKNPFSNTTEFRRKIFPFYLKELELQYNPRNESIFEPHIPFMSGTAPALRVKSNPLLNAVSQRE